MNELQTKKWSFNRSSVKLLGVFCVLILVMSVRDTLFSLFQIEKNYTTVSLFYGIGLAVLSLCGFALGFADFKRNGFKIKPSMEGFMVIFLSVIIFISAFTFLMKAYAKN